VKAPLIAECPVNLECKVVQVLALGGAMSCFFLLVISAFPWHVLQCIPVEATIRVALEVKGEAG